MITIVRVLLACSWAWASTAWATAAEQRVVYVDCGAAPGGDGSAALPYDTIGAGVAAGRPLSATYDVVVSIREGTCQRESIPIVLDYPVDLRGARWARYDGSLFPIDGQYRDTLVTWDAPPSPVPTGLSFFVVTADDVHISRLSIDGKATPLGNVRGPPPIYPVGITVSGDGYLVDQVRIVGVATPFRSDGASGVFANNYVDTRQHEGVVLFGGDPSASVLVVNNRIAYRTLGVVAVGAIAGLEGVPVGKTLDAVIARNDVVTTYTDTGPVTPNALRVIPAGALALDGHVRATFLWNRVRGPTMFSIMVHAGTPTRSADVDYTGVVEAVFHGTTLDAAAAQTADASISFTQARVSRLPCELDPSIPRGPDCPFVTTYWEYYAGASIEIRHGGELDDALIDHPAQDPVDLRTLDNTLVINDEVIANETYVVLP